MSQLLLLSPTSLSAPLAQRPHSHSPALEPGPLMRGSMPDPSLSLLAPASVPVSARVTRSHSPPSTLAMPMAAAPKRVGVSGAGLWSPQLPSRASAASNSFSNHYCATGHCARSQDNHLAAPSLTGASMSVTPTPTPTSTPTPSRRPVSPLALTRLHLQARVEPSPSSSTPSPSAECALTSLASPKRVSPSPALQESGCGPLSPSECSGYLSLLQSQSPSPSHQSRIGAIFSALVTKEHKQHSICACESDRPRPLGAGSLHPPAPPRAQSEQHSSGSQRHALTRAEELSDRDSVHMPEVDEAIITKKKAGAQDTAPSLATAQSTRSKRMLLQTHSTTRHLRLDWISLSLSLANSGEPIHAATSHRHVGDAGGVVAVGEHWPVRVHRSRAVRTVRNARALFSAALALLQMRRRVCFLQRLAQVSHSHILL